MANVLDIVHRLSFEVTGDNAIDDAQKSIQTSIKTIDEQHASIKRLETLKALTHTADIKRIEQLNQAIANRRQAIVIETAAIQTQIRTNDQLRASLTRQALALAGLRTESRRTSEEVRRSRFYLEEFAHQGRVSTLALNDLSRIIQDLPYGFIAISNNLNPMLESFQRLRTETGSAGAAFKAMAASLIGPAGLGLAIAAASSLIVTFGDKLFNHADAAKKAKDAQEEFNESILNLSKADIANLTFGKVYSAFEDLNTEMARANLELAKARGVINGEVFASEKDQFDKSQALLGQEESSLQRRLQLLRTVDSELEQVRNNLRQRDNVSEEDLKKPELVRSELSKRLSRFNPEERIAALNVFDEVRKGATNALDVVDNLSKAIDQTETEQSRKQTQRADEAIAFQAKQAEAQYQLSVQLQARIRENDEKYQQQRIEDQEDRTRETEATIKKRLELEKQYQIQLLNVEQGEARKRGELNGSNRGSFDTLRAQVTRETNLKILTEMRAHYRRLKKEEESFLADLSGLDLKNEGDRLKIQLQTGEDTLNQRHEIALKQSAQALADNSKDYDAAFDSARKLGEKTLEIDQYYQERERILKEQGVRALLQADEDYLKDRIELLQKYAQSGINAVLADADIPISKLQDRYDQRLISYNRYRRSRLRIDLQAAVDTAKVERAQAEQALREAQAQQQRVLGNPGATPLDRQGAQSGVDGASRNLTNARNKVIEAENAQQKQRLDWINELKEAYYSLTEAISTAFNALYEQQQRLLDQEIQIRQERVNQAVRLAERGNAEILQDEQNKLNEAQATREKIAKRQIELNAILQASNAAVALTEAIGAIVKAAATGDPYTIAARVAAAVAALVAGVAALKGAFSAGGFEEGGYTGDGGKKQPAGIVHKGEFVVTAENTRKFRPVLEYMHETGRMPETKTLPVSGGSAKEFKQLQKEMQMTRETLEGMGVNVQQLITNQGILQSVETARRIERNRWS